MSDPSYNFFDAMSELTWQIQDHTGGAVRTTDNYVVHLARDGEVTKVPRTKDIIGDLQKLHAMLVPTAPLGEA